MITKRTTFRLDTLSKFIIIFNIIFSWLLLILNIWKDIDNLEDIFQETIWGNYKSVEEHIDIFKGIFFSMKTKL
jgi:hypothetical protein